MAEIDDSRVEGMDSLPTPRQLKADLPRTPKAFDTVILGRTVIEWILDGIDHRFLAIIGPCSIHDEDSAYEYASRLKLLAEAVADRIAVVMRVYFEKPRTTVGWKGLISDPDLDGSDDIRTGLTLSRKILIYINELGLPVGSEFLDPVLPQYNGDLVSWASIGARTTESQTHREMASGLSMPIGFKNTTAGDIGIALNAMESARARHSFWGIDEDANPKVIRTSGNPFGHLVLRGGCEPNYGPISVMEACQAQAKRGWVPKLLIDGSHGNSKKKHQGQREAWQSIVQQRAEGSACIRGGMLESHLKEGRQDVVLGRPLVYGQSITDECIGWEETENLVMWAHDTLKNA